MALNLSAKRPLGSDWMEEDDTDNPQQAKKRQRSLALPDLLLQGQLSDRVRREVSAIAAGGVHSLAITEDAEVVSTGVNDEGALGRRTDNKLWEQWGMDLGKDLPAASDTFWEKVALPISHGKPVEVSAGDSHSAVLTDSGAIWGWGTFRDAGGVYSFQPGIRIALLPILIYQPSSGEEAVRKIVSGTDHMLALTAAGKVLSWGTGWQGQLGRIPKEAFASFSAAKAAFRKAEKELEALESGLMAAKDSDAIFQRAYDQAQAEVQRAKQTFQPFDEGLMSLQLRPAPVPLPVRAVDVAAGWYTSYVSDETGRVFAFGLDNYGQASAGPARDDADSDERFIFSPQPVLPLRSERIRGIAGGIHHALALTEAGRVLSFGRTTFGRLGRLNDEIDQNVAREQPLPVDGLHGITAMQVSAGEMVSACVSTSGVAFLWGCGTNAQLGNGSRRSGTKAVGLEESETALSSDDNLDEAVPWRLDSALLQDREIIRVEFGGQHTLLLAKPR